MDTFEGRKAAGSIIEGMRSEGISPGLVLTPAEVEWVADAGREGAEAARMHTERRALEERLARSTDPDDAGRALTQFRRTHSDVMERDEGWAATQRCERQLIRQAGNRDPMELGADVRTGRSRDKDFPHRRGTTPAVAHDYA